MYLGQKVIGQNFKEVHHEWNGVSGIVRFIGKTLEKKLIIGIEFTIPSTHGHSGFGSILECKPNCGYFFVLHDEQSSSYNNPDSMMHLKFISIEEILRELKI